MPIKLPVWLDPHKTRPNNGFHLSFLPLPSLLIPSHAGLSFPLNPSCRSPFHQLSHHISLSLSLPNHISCHLNLNEVDKLLLRLGSLSHYYSTAECKSMQGGKKPADPSEGKTKEPAKKTAKAKSKPKTKPTKSPTSSDVEVTTEEATKLLEKIKKRDADKKARDKKAKGQY